jgi:acyl-CoA reductase-like NAD-dependent aldehyde dehydrogenase
MAFAAVQDSYSSFVGGEWIDGGEVRQSIDPATEEPIAELHDATEGVVARAVGAALEAQRGWQATPWTDRAAALDELAARLEQDAETFARLDVVDAGIPLRGMRRDVSNAVRYLRYFAAIASELKGHTLESPDGSLNMALREPYGVVGRIIPFNHPLQFAASAVAAPLAAGNAVVLKPSEHTSVSALHFARLAADVLPAGLFSVVVGAGTVGSALVRHPDVSRIGFTGSVAGGRAVLRDAADQIKPVSLELGGKNPLIICPDAEVEEAIKLAEIGMNLQRTAGQSCGSTSRVYVHDDVHDEFVNGLVARFAALRVGDPQDDEIDVGPLAFEAHRDRVLDAVARAEAAGAERVIGGSRPPGLDRGFFVSPTLFVGVGDAMDVARQEIFGPVVAVLRWRDEDDVVARANHGVLGLTANVVTNDLSRALRLARRLQAGYVWVNGRGQRPFGAPFGGYKQSGLGEENSLGELLSYTQTKNLSLGAVA